MNDGPATQATPGAPVWVNWLAQDAGGAWWGYSVEPLQAPAHWYENEMGRYIALGRGRPDPNWRDSLCRCGNSR